MAKKKHKEAGYDETLRSALVSLEGAQHEAREAFNRAFERLERKASDRLERIVSGTLEEATAVTAALHDVLAESQSSSSEALGELDASRRQLRERLAQIFEEAEGLRVAIEDARAATEAVANEVDARGQERLEELVTQREQVLERVHAETTDRIIALCCRVEEQAATVETDVERLRARAGREFETILAEAQGHRVAIEDARAATEAVANDVEASGRERLEEADRRSQELVAQFDGVVAQVRDQAAAQIAEAGQWVEEQATQREQALERVHAEVTDRMTASQRALDEQAQQNGEQAARHLAELLVAVDRDAQELQGLARVRIEEALTAVDEQSTAALSRAAERAGELLVQAEADGQALHTQRVQCDGLADSLVAKAQSALDCVADAGEALEQIRGYAMTAGDLVLQLSKDAEDARQLVDSLHPGINDEIASAGPAETASADDAAGGLSDGAVADWTEPVHWLLPLETSPGDAPKSSTAVEDALEYEAPFEENFFSRLAAELRADPDSGEFPRGDESEDAMPVGTASPRGAPALPPSASTQQVALLETATVESTPHPPAAGQVVATGPVTVVAPLTALTACVQELGQGVAGPSVRIEVTHTASAETEASSCLRLIAYDSAGWWEYGDIPARVDTESAVSTVVEFGELREALTVIDRFVGGSEARILLEGNVTIGNHLLLARDANEVPPLSDDRTRIERIDLQAANRPGVVLETQVGRLFVPPELLTYLRRRQAADAELVTVDGMPCLTAQVSGSSADPALTIVARLQELGEHDDPIASERRTTPGNEVTQLVNALSTAATAQELERILKVGVGYTRRRAAAHPALPQEVIHDLIREGTEAMRAAAASNVSISTEAADLAVADPSSVVRAAVAANPSIPERGLGQLASDPVAQVRAHVASNATTTCDLLERLAEDQDSSVRAAVASQENVAIETLLVLARDPDPMVCAAVASNPICPAEVLNELVSIVPDSVLANPSASPTLLIAGSVIDAARLRATVAGNPATPVKRLRKLARDKDLNVLRAVAEHPEAPSSARRRARRALDASREGTSKP